jgi:hypothetical protein
VLSPRHATAWAAIAGKDGLNTTVEQFLLPACLDFHRSDPGSPHRGIYLRYLFPSTSAAFDPAQAARVGFTHLLAEAKQDARTTTRLEERVRREDAAFYRLCERVAGSASGGAMTQEAPGEDWVSSSSGSSTMKSVPGSLTHSVNTLRR